jgi:hypothetical protein
VPHFTDDHNAAFYSLGTARPDDLIQLKLWGGCADRAEEIVRAICAVLRARDLVQVEHIARHTYLSRDITRLDNDQQPDLPQQM